MQNCARPGTLIILTIALSILASSTTALAIEEKGLKRRSERLIRTLDDIQFEDVSKIPSEVLKNAKGIMIFRQYEAGFVLGGKGGFGIALLRNEDGDWGSPAWYKTGEGSGGLQIGMQKLNVAFLLMNDNALKMLSKKKFRIGIDAAATWGPAGSNVEAKVGYKAPVLIYSVTEGLYAGATFEGGFFLPDRKSNLAMYEDIFTTSEILSGKAGPPPAYIQPLIDRLYQIEAGDS